MKKPSVHSTNYPTTSSALIDDQLEREMDVIIRWKNLGLGLRNSAKIKVRQPLECLLIVPGDDTERSALFTYELIEMVREEVNVKSVAVAERVPQLKVGEWVSITDKNTFVALSTTISPKLAREGIARDFVRQVQILRKQRGLNIQDRVSICYSADGEVARAIREWDEYIKDETLAVLLERGKSVVGKEIRLAGENIVLDVVKVEVKGESE